MSKNNHQQIDQEVKESVYCIYMLWFKFIHGLNFIFLLLFGMSLKQWKIKFTSRIKLNYIIYSHVNCSATVLRFDFCITTQLKINEKIKQARKGCPLSANC